MTFALPSSLLITSAFGQVCWLESFRLAADLVGSALRIVAGSTQPTHSPACLLADGAVTLPAVADPVYIETLLAACIRLDIDLVVPGSPRELRKLAASRELFEANGTTVVVAGQGFVSLSRDLLARDQLAIAAGATSRGLAPRDAVARSPGNYAWPMDVFPRKWLDQDLATVRLRHPSELARIPQKAPVLLASACRGWKTVVAAFFNRSGVMEWRGSIRTGTLDAGGIPFAETIADNAATDLVDRLAPRLPDAAGPVVFEFYDDGRGGLVLDDIKPILPRELALIDRAGSDLARRTLMFGMDNESSPHRQWHTGMRYLTYSSPMILVSAKGSAPGVGSQ